MSVNKEDYGPGLAPAIFLGFLTFIIGAILGAASMVSQAVTPLSKTANKDDLEPGVVYYIRGDRLGRAPWEAKEEAWKAGTVSVLEVSEQELNLWSSKRLLTKLPPAPAEDASWMDKLDMSATAVNFLIEDNTLQLATELSVPGLLGDRSFVYQVRGSFIREGDSVRFVPETGSLGSAPLGNIPAVKGMLFSMVSSLFNNTEAGDWVPGSLENLDSVVISEGQLVLKRG